MARFLHVLFSPKAEGCPRLALELLRQEREQSGRSGTVAFCSMEPSDLLPEFQELGQPIHHLHWRSRGFLRLTKDTYRVLKTVRPSGVICHTLGLHVSVSIASRTLGIPVVVHLGNAPPLSKKATLRKLRLQMAVGKPFVTAYAACSNYIAHVCTDTYGLPRRAVSAIPNGIDLPRFLAVREKRSARQMGPLHIGVVASLEESKDHVLLLKGFSALLARGVQARLHIIGDGTQRVYLEQLSHRLGIDEHVRWTGTVSDVTEELQRLDVFAFPAKEVEGLGIAMVEALAAGIPVVASDVGACREALAGGRWGYLVAGRDPETWADALSNAQSLPIPASEELARYDIRETFRAYAELLGR